MPRKSTQTEVVRAVKALSALDKAAATRPSRNRMGKAQPMLDFKATVAKSKSARSTAVPVASVCISSRAPSDKNNRLTNTKTTEKDATFNWASRRFLQLKFFCIMSWSNPVMHSEMNAPAMNCLTP